ncbi:ParM/StbA family protein [Nostoc sp.]
MSRPFTLAGLRQDFEGTVRFLVPERSQWDEDCIRKTLVSDTHQVTVNGRSYRHRIKSVEFYPETDLAVSHSYKTGKLDMEGDTLCIDIGGGTTNYVVMSPDGNVLTRRSIPKVGGVSLANDIINSDLMQGYAKRESVAFKVPKVMDAIADGSLVYGRKYDFSPVFPTLRDSWFNNLMDSITTAANDYLSDVTNIMLIGGNANLVRQKLSSQPGFYIPANPQLSNIQALLAM